MYLTSSLAVATSGAPFGTARPASTGMKARPLGVFTSWLSCSTTSSRSTALSGVASSLNASPTIYVDGSLPAAGTHDGATPATAYRDLTTALATAQALSPGTYIAMNGRVFAWDNVQKNRAAGVFQTM